MGHVEYEKAILHCVEVIMRVTVTSCSFSWRLSTYSQQQGKQEIVAIGMEESGGCASNT